MRLLLLLGFIFSCFCTQAWASRVIEIEDYFTNRTTNFVRMRYPNRPFTVYVKVDAGDSSDVRKRKLSKSETALPYLDMVEENDDIWNRTDIPMGALIGYLKNIYIKVDLDAGLSAAELEVFREDLFKTLKLSPSSDKIEITKMNWTKNPEAFERRLWIGLGLATPLILFLIFFLVSKLSVRSLVRGLSAPISEIGKSTQNFASNALTASAVSDTGPRANSTVSNLSASSGDSLHDLRQSLNMLMKKYSDLFEHPDVDFMEFIEKEGTKYPHEMGAILAELPREVLEKVFAYGSGDWWLEALAKPSDINSQVISLFGRFQALELKKRFRANNAPLLDSQFNDFGLILNRLEDKELGPILQKYSFEKVKPVLFCLTQAKMISVAKYMYPGQWAEVLKNQEKIKLEESLAKEALEAALEAKPLRNGSEIAKFFDQVDQTRYLDLCSTKDEREVYRVLPPESAILDSRKSLYSLFENSDDTLKQVIAETSLKSWAIILPKCDREESVKIFSMLSDRQKYVLKQLIQTQKQNLPNEEQIINAKQTILNKYKEKEKIKNWQTNPDFEKEQQVA